MFEGFGRCQTFFLGSTNPINLKLVVTIPLDGADLADDVLPIIKMFVFFDSSASNAWNRQSTRNLRV